MRLRDSQSIWPAGMNALARPRLPAIMAMGTVQLMERLDAELSEQQKRVLMLLSEGYANKAIAWILGIEDATAKAHVSTILKKLQMTNRTQAALLAQRVRLSGADYSTQDRHPTEPAKARPGRREKPAGDPLPGCT